MTVGALRSSVTLLQGPARSRVIKAFWSSIRPLDEGEVTACVLRVAGRASRSPESAMGAFASCGEPADVLVTVHAECIHGFLPSSMAPGTVQRSFKLPVCAGQRAR